MKVKLQSVIDDPQYRIPPGHFSAFFMTSLIAQHAADARTLKRALTEPQKKAAK